MYLKAFQILFHFQSHMQNVQNIFRKVTDILLQLLQMDEPYNLSQYVTLNFSVLYFSK